MKRNDLARRATAEFIGSILLLAAIVGSGIMGEKLANGNAAIALLANSVAVGAALIALILMFGEISGAHFNPAVTLSDALLGGGIKWRDVPFYIIAQISGAFVGVGLANTMFGLPMFFVSSKVRAGNSQILSEFVATFGLLAVIWGCSRRSNVTPFAVAAYIVAAFWFTASTSFANPAVTLARTASDTFAGIRLADAPGFIGAQIIGAFAATVLFQWLMPIAKEDAKNIVLPHQ